MAANAANTANIATSSPDQILDYAPRHPRPLRLDANVVAYFGDMIQNLRITLQNSGGKAPSNTASARNRS